MWETECRANTPASFSECVLWRCFDYSSCCCSLLFQAERFVFIQKQHIPYVWFIKLICVNIFLNREQIVWNSAMNFSSLSVGHYELCRDDIGDLPGSPEHLWLRENANEIG